MHRTGKVEFQVVRHHLAARVRDVVIQFQAFEHPGRETQFVLLERVRARVVGFRAGHGVLALAVQLHVSQDARFAVDRSGRDQVEPGRCELKLVAERQIGNAARVLARFWCDQQGLGQRPTRHGKHSNGPSHKLLHPFIVRCKM